MIYNLNLVVSSVLITVAVTFVLLFYREWRKQARSENEQYLPLALMVLYLLLSIGFIMMTNSNYFIDDSLFQVYLQKGFYFYLIMSACVVIIGILVYVAERIIPRNTHHVFLIYYGFLAASFYIFKTIQLPFIGIYLILLIPIIVLICLFGYHLIWKASGQMRQKMFIVTVGYILFIFAIVLLIRFILVTEYVEPFVASNYSIPLEVKALVLIASILAGWGFYSIPSFTEFDWKEKIHELYIISTSGICLYQQKFRMGHVKDEDLFGGGLVAMQSLIQEMIQSQKVLRVIDHEEVKILFESSPHALFIMVAKDDLYIVHHKLQQLAKDFELIYGDMMPEWGGDLNLFKPLESIVNRIFEKEN